MDPVQSITKQISKPPDSGLAGTGGFGIGRFFGAWGIPWYEGSGGGMPPEPNMPPMTEVGGGGTPPEPNMPPMTEVGGGGMPPIPNMRDVVTFIGELAFNGTGSA